MFRDRRYFPKDLKNADDEGSGHCILRERALGMRSMSEEPIGNRGPRNRRELAVTHGILLSKCGEDGKSFRSEALQDVRCLTLVVAGEGIILDKTSHGRRTSAVGVLENLHLNIDPPAPRTRAPFATCS